MHNDKSNRRRGSDCWYVPSGAKTSTTVVYYIKDARVKISYVTVQQVSGTQKL